MNEPLIFKPAEPLWPGYAREACAFMPGVRDKDGCLSTLVTVTAALGIDRVGLSWVDDKETHCMHFTAEQARSVAAELLASADEIDLDAELAPAIAASIAEWDAEQNAEPKKDTP